ncbi:MAG TPA: DUF695 domain-containing protein [Sphingobacteriaceae bacterium]
MRILIPVLFLALLITACSGQENPDMKARRQLSALADSVARPRPDTLHFVVDGKPCYAVIDRRYRNFTHRAEFPLSLFITLETLKKDRNGHPGQEEARAHSRLQSDITASLDAISVNAYIGKTTMTGFEDLIYYIKEGDKEKVQARVKQLQQQDPRIREFTFEKDPEWEAVSEFFQAMEQQEAPAP